METTTKGHGNNYAVGAFLMDLYKTFGCIPYASIFARFTTYGPQTLS